MQRRERAPRGERGDDDADGRLLDVDRADEQHLDRGEDRPQDCEPRKRHSRPVYPTWMVECTGERSAASRRSEEHTSELQSRQYLVCRLLLEKKKTKNKHRSRTWIV